MGIGSGSNASCGPGGKREQWEWQMKPHLLTRHSFTAVGLVLNRPGSSTLLAQGLGDHCHKGCLMIQRPYLLSQPPFVLENSDMKTKFTDTCKRPM